jgi:hypothetical protein
VTALEANKLIGVTPQGGTTTEKTGSVAKNAWVQLGTFPVTASSNFTVAMTGTGDADLYVKFGAQPTAAAYDCSPYGGDSNEACNLTVPAGATQAFVAVLGYSDTAATYTAKITSGGSIPTTYVFNDKAAKLYKVHTDVDYISESPAGTDGNLASTIDRYTHTDRYDYILEVDAAGKIIGGEWLGESKKAHPDFVWLPYSVRGSDGRWRQDHLRQREGHLRPVDERRPAAGHRRRQGGRPSPARSPRRRGSSSARTTSRPARP